MREIIVTMRLRTKLINNLTVQDTIEFFLDGVFEGGGKIEKIEEVPMTFEGEIK